MCGCARRAAMRTSRSNRSCPMELERSGLRILMATVRPCLRSSARKTVAIPPLPTSATMRYRSLRAERRLSYSADTEIPPPPPPDGAVRKPPDDALLVARSTGFRLSRRSDRDDFRRHIRTTRRTRVHNVEVAELIGDSATPHVDRPCFPGQEHVLEEADHIATDTDLAMAIEEPGLDV